VINLTQSFQDFQARLISEGKIARTEKQNPLSKKYQDISKAAQELAKSGDLNLRHIRTWSKQDDMGVPIQLRRFFIPDRFAAENALRYIRNLLPNYWTRVYFQHKALKDDLNIIIDLGFEFILEEHPVTETPFVRDVYEAKGFKFNSRYLRYVYLAGQIRKYELLKENTYQVHIDVGNFYGGLQAILKYYFPLTTFISVELEHQLFRSYIFHKQMFPETIQIVGLIEFEKYARGANKKDSVFIYLLPEDFDFIGGQIEVDLLTNYLSYGEMSRQNFENYYTSITNLKAKRIHLVNRFISSPRIDPTYDSDISVFDYILSSHKKFFFDIFPIHHYMLIKRKFLKSFGFRNASSPQFEMMLERLDVQE
jgi:putative sugar O-methyltransferase